MNFLIRKTAILFLILSTLQTDQEKKWPPEDEKPRKIQFSTETKKVDGTGIKLQPRESLEESDDVEEDEDEDSFDEGMNLLLERRMRSKQQIEADIEKEQNELATREIEYKKDLENLKHIKPTIINGGCLKKSNSSKKPFTKPSTTVTKPTSVFKIPTSSSVLATDSEIRTPPSSSAKTKAPAINAPKIESLPPIELLPPSKLSASLAYSFNSNDLLNIQATTYSTSRQGNVSLYVLVYPASKELGGFRIDTANKETKKVTIFEPFKILRLEIKNEWATSLDREEDSAEIKSKVLSLSPSERVKEIESFSVEKFSYSIKSVELENVRDQPVKRLFKRVGENGQAVLDVWNTLVKNDAGKFFLQWNLAQVGGDRETTVRKRKVKNFKMKGSEFRVWIKNLSGSRLSATNRGNQG